MDEPPLQRQDPSEPSFSRREERRVADTLRTVALTFLVLMVVLLAASFTVFPYEPEPTGLALMTTVIGLILLSLWLERRRRVGLGSHVLVWMTWIASTAGMIGAGGIGTPGFSFYAVSIAAAGLLLGGRAALGVAVLSGASGAAIAWLEMQGALPEPVIVYGNVASLWWIEMTLFAALAALVYVSVSHVRTALAEAERSEHHLEERNLELSRTLAEKRLAEEGEALLDDAMGQASEAILIVDPSREVRYVNAAFERLTGRRAEELRGFDVREFFAGLEEELAPEVLATLAEGRPWHGRVRLGPPRDMVVDASLSAVRGPDGEVSHYVAVARDVTREAALESELRQSQKLEALGQLAGGVAHDFNNLLAVIQGYAEMVGQALEDPEQREFVEQIEGAARQAAGLTAQLLAFGRRQVQHPRVVDLNAVVREADGMLRALVPEDIEIERHLEPGLDHVRLDPRQVHQVLLNLAANARDAMPEGGRLVIATRGLPPDGVELSVADSGQGMDEETRERIFEPFFTTKRPGEGTGLGLASVYGIVEQCGGTVEVESRPGEGSCFRIRFPVVDAPLEVPEIARPVGVPARRARVLVAEDQESVRRLLSRQLRQAGFEVMVADDGQAALDLLDADGYDGAPIDVLVTDVTMPRLGGAGLGQRLRQRWPALGLLFISGYWPEDLVSKIEADPRADFLAKPFGHEALIAKVESLRAVPD